VLEIQPLLLASGERREIWEREQVRAMNQNLLFLVALPKYILEGHTGTSGDANNLIASPASD
jgi:hypothetical protein